MELLWRLLWDNTLSSEMAALKKKDADEIDETCDKSLRVYWRLFEKIFVFATEFCRSNMSQKNQIRQNLCDLLRRQKFCCRCKDFHKNSQVHMKRFVTPMCRRNVLLHFAHGVICRRDLSPSMFQT